MFKKRTWNARTCIWTNTCFWAIEH